MDDDLIKVWEGVYRRWVRDVQYFREIWTVGITGVMSVGR